MDVRRIRADEGALLRTIRLRALAGAPAAFSSTYADSVTFPDEAWARRAADCSTSAKTSLFFAEHEGVLVGMAGGFFEADDPVPSLISMWVEPSARGLGGGEALIDAVDGWARLQGATSVQLWVVSTNAPALALYRRVGFVEVGEAQPLPSNPSLLEQRMVRAG